MVNSMTGFGVGAAVQNGWRAEVTLRTLNNRFLSVHVRSLHDRPQLQVKAEGIVKQAFGRGDVNVSISLKREPDASGGEFFSGAMIDEYLKALRGVVNEYSLPSPPTLADLIALGALRPADIEEEDSWPVIEEALLKALAAANESRGEEGAHLACEIESILDGIEVLAEEVKKRLPAVIVELRTRLQEKVAALVADVDPTRMEMEIALLAERYDVQEEIARLEGHLARARALLTSSDPIGKELDFLSQEFLREVNTLGSKSRDLEINSLVIDMKLLVNSFKEQVQNVE